MRWESPLKIASTSASVSETILSKMGSEFSGAEPTSPLPEAPSW